MGEPVLRTTPLLRGVSEAGLAAASAASTRVELPAGQYLFHAGDEATSLFVLVRGRLEVVAPDGALLRTLAPGDAVGELAFLTAALRSADVRARRDCSVVRLPREAFLTLLATEPVLLRTIVEVLARQVSDGPGGAPGPGPGVLAVVALTDDDPARLHHVLPGSGYLDEVAAGGDWPAAVERLEAATPTVLLGCAAASSSAWRRFCVRTADRTVVLADGPSDCAPYRSVAHGLAVRLAPGERWPDGAGTRPVLRQRLERPEDLATFGRRLAGRSPGLVLSGGGARGLAHVGVLAQLEDSGWWPDRWGGTSMGAFVAALGAMGLDAAGIADVCRHELVERRPFRDWALMPRQALLRAGRARAMLTRVFGTLRIEDLRHDYFCVTADLLTGDLAVHREGPLVELVGASMSIPGVAPPVRLGGSLHVDGGVLDNLPVDVMAETGEGPVVAVDVMNRGSGLDDPKLLEVIGQALTIGGRQRVVANLARADVVITPALDGIGLFDFDAAGRAMAAGRAAALAQAEALPPRA